MDKWAARTSTAYVGVVATEPTQPADDPSANGSRPKAGAHGRATSRIVTKRIFDILGASILLVAFAPVFLIVVIAIKLDSTGPAFFIQKRAGARLVRGDTGEKRWEPRPFDMYKFRSMSHKADETVHQDYIKRYLNGDGKNPDGARTQFKLMDDERVTRVGRVIRRTSIDELPQLINVLKGEMSLVGPRPVPLYEVEAYEPHHHERLRALPGMTGMWQVYGRGHVPFEEMMELDIAYVRGQSLLLDLKLLALTLPAVIRGAGAE